MPLLNFKPQFVEPIRATRKRHTIRGDRKIPIKVGDKLYLYCGARTKRCFRILPNPVICTKVQRITILEDRSLRRYIAIEGIRLDKDEREALARADGFDDFTTMMRFWDGRLPFEGQIIHWKTPTSTISTESM